VIEWQRIVQRLFFKCNEGINHPLWKLSAPGFTTEFIVGSWFETFEARSLKASQFDSNPGQEKSNQIPNQKEPKRLSVSSANQVGLLIVSSKFLGVMVINPRKSSISGSFLLAGWTTGWMAEIRRLPVEGKVVYHPNIYRGFIHFRWLFPGFLAINSMINPILPRGQYRFSTPKATSR